MKNNATLRWTAFVSTALATIVGFCFPKQGRSEDSETPISASLEDEFREPPREFTLLPFWFWNDELSNDEIARQIEDFDIQKYQGEYLRSAKKDRGSTYLGKFFLAAMAQKSMVTDKIFKSGNLLAGFSIDYHEGGFRGIRDYLMLVEQERKKAK